MRFSAKHWAYSDKPSFSSQSASRCIGAPGGFYSRHPFRTGRQKVYHTCQVIVITTGCPSAVRSSTPPCWTGHPLFAAAKDRSLSHRLGDFQLCVSNKTDPRPSCRDKRSHLCGAYLDGDEKNQHHSTHTAAEQPLTGSTATRSKLSVEHSHEAGQAAALSR